jgi:hypothetical protein
MKTVPLLSDISKLISIEIIEYSLLSPEKELPQNITFNYKIQVQHRISLKDNTIFVLSSFETLCHLQQSKIGHAKIGMNYKFDDISSISSQIGEIRKLDDNVAAQLNAVTLSTCRGVLFTLFRGTFLHKAILPIFDVSTLKFEGS